MAETTSMELSGTESLVGNRLATLRNWSAHLSEDTSRGLPDSELLDPTLASVSRLPGRGSTMSTRRLSMSVDQLSDGDQFQQRFMSQLDSYKVPVCNIGKSLFWQFSLRSLLDSFHLLQ